MLSIGQFITPDKAIVCTLTSNGYKFLTLNLVRLLQKAGVPWKLCIVCTDKASYRFFRQESIPCLLMDSPLPDSQPKITPFGCRAFQQLNLKKLELLAELCASEADYIVYMDGDIAVYADFLPDLVQRLAAESAAPILLQCDEQSRADCSGAPCPNACTGFIAWRRADVPAPLFQVAGQGPLWRQCPEDQVFVNHRLRELAIPFQTLPRDKYPNGQFASLYGKDTAQKGSTFILHYNWRVGETKRQSMLANGDWIIPY